MFYFHFVVWIVLRYVHVGWVDPPVWFRLGRVGSGIWVDENRPTVNSASAHARSTPPAPAIYFRSPSQVATKTFMSPNCSANAAQLIKFDDSSRTDSAPINHYTRRDGDFVPFASMLGAYYVTAVERRKINYFCFLIHSLYP